jgi:hypothetical protein
MLRVRERGRGRDTGSLYKKALEEKEAIIYYYYYLITGGKRRQKHRSNVF